jgi:purine-binding chemotaxis protein CheW
MNLSQAAAADPADAATPAAPAAREVLAFRLGAEEYAIDIVRVREIRAYERPTRLAHAPAYVRGVINLRGAIVPIVDLRLKLGIAAAELDALAVVVVLEVGRRIVGAVVDAVHDVLPLDPAALRELPALEGRDPDSALQALGTVGDRLLVLLDAERLLAGSELGLPVPNLQ